MQRQEAHRRALRAAAKVAFSVSLVGCGAGEATEPSTSEEALSMTSKVLCPRGVCGLRENAPFREANYACCRAHVQTYDETRPNPTVTRAEQACCTALIEQLDGPANGGLTLGDVYEKEDGWELLSRCCTVTGNPGGPACTPWGPPVPPAFEEVAT